MPSISLTAVWDETRAYLTREIGILIPVALGTIGLATVILSLATPEQAAGSAVQPGPWMFWLIPWLLLLTLGGLALSALAIIPGISVREALTRAASRLGHAVGVTLLLGFAATLLVLLVGSALGIVGRVAGLAANQAAAFGIVVALPLIFLLAVRFLFLFPALIDQKGAIAALRASWRASAPCQWRLMLLWIGIGAASLLLLAAVEYGVGSLLLLLARALGDPRLGELLVQLVVAFVSSLIQLVTISYFARLYWCASGSSSGI